MSNCTKTRTVLAFVESRPYGEYKPTYRVHLAPFEQGRSHQLILDYNVYEDMVKPDTITVTIEPSDLLNDGPTPESVALPDRPEEYANDVDWASAIVVSR